jgi:predicted PurR-regulated permease PerM
MSTPSRRDLAQVFFTVIVLALLVGGSLFILMPFLPALVWATMIVVSTWPLMRGLQKLLRGSRALATTGMVLAMLLVILLPIFVAVSSIAENGMAIRERFQTLQTSDLPKPPAWVGKVPAVGPKVVKEWNRVIDEGADGLRARLAPHIRTVVAWVTAKAGSVGMLGIHILLTIAISGILYMNGEAAAGGVVRFVSRLTPERGEAIVVLAGQAIRSVAMGIVVTAIVQAVLGGIGLAVCGVPAAPVLTGVMFLLAVAQLGPVLVLAPAVCWLFYTGRTGWAVLLLVISVFVVSLDNVLRPILIRRGANLPLLLILAGVMGGLLAFGLVGLFVGPCLLAVAYTLLDDWISEPAEP